MIIKKKKKGYDYGKDNGEGSDSVKLSLYHIICKQWLIIPYVKKIIIILSEVNSDINTVNKSGWHRVTFFTVILL